jgi:hypothetical protein
MPDPTPLLETTSPNGDVQAIVEESGGAVHFYLWGAPDSGFGVRSCWVRNLVPAPETIDREAMKTGHAPLMPRRSCAHPGGALRPVPAELKAVLFE